MTASTPRAADANHQTPLTRADIVPCTLQEYLFCFLRLGSFGFGGLIAGATFVLGKRVITNFPTVLIVLAILGVLSTVRKVPEPLVILAAGAVGLLLQWAAHT